MTSMYTIILLILVFAPFQEKEHAILSQNDGWIWLFNGSGTAHWKGVRSADFPEKGWEIIGNELVENRDKAAGRGGDIITKEEYSSFDLQFEFKFTQGANGGIKYFVEFYPSGSVLGCEYQIIDDQYNKDIQNDLDGKRLTASLYELFESENKKLNPAGHWNSGRILVEGTHVEHWLNGAKVLEYERGSKVFMEAKAKSKFKDVEDFGTMDSGYIMLTDHGDQLAYRNIKIRKL